MSYKGISTDDKHRIFAALKERGAGSCPRCNDSKWIVSEFSRIEVRRPPNATAAKARRSPR